MSYWGRFIEGLGLGFGIKWDVTFKLAEGTVHAQLREQREQRTAMGLNMK